ncbi:GTP pyrophosphokinase [Hymenobacter fodinae]|uniref:RelA/SpoT domain-containing protein n=1 Tax=Hymenobacter fodinae TaxID=2510796 RepID=A0A4Z0NXZ7_9BACT|nr:RelA/SpoT domain-containing protein [Hymenobacter fodinae]TGE03329.1 hypothetical protein EU556_25780 [Hymenobacter fodinae]
MVAHERELSEKFSSVRDSLAKWGAFVDSKVMELASEAFRNTSFLQIPPKFRCKDETSFIRKALYRGKNDNYRNPIVDIEDKVATRIILLTTDNVETVKGLITECQAWDHKISKDTKQFSKENPNLFDYQSVHIVVWPKENFDNVPKEVLTCEIQIRTLLQHAYAEVTHDSVYKGPHQNNNDIKHELSKCMALMETTDDIFRSVFNAISLKADNSQDAFTQLLAQATNIYNGIISGVSDYRNSDVYFLDAVRFVFQKKPITIDLIRAYTSTHEQDIKIAIKTNGSILMREPVVLILFCYIEYFDDFLSEHWPLSIKIIDNMRESLGISAGEY